MTLLLESPGNSFQELRFFDSLSRLGALIQTAWGSLAGVGMPRTKRSGFFSYAL